METSSPATVLPTSTALARAIADMNILALVQNSSYLTGLNAQLLAGVPGNARDALDMAGKLPLALKANAIGIPPHELNIDPAQAGGLLGKFDALGVPRAKLPENLQEFFGLFASERQNVLRAVEHVRASPLIGPRVPVHGALLDLGTGRLEVLVNGYQVFATANAGMSPMTESVAEAARLSAPVPPASESPGNLSLAEIQLTSRRIGESVAPLRLESTAMPAIPETTPAAAAQTAPAKPPPVPVDPVAALKRVVDLARHYRIIGGDGKQYGPVPATVLLRWINDGRVDAETAVKVDGTNAWVKLHELGEAISRLRGPRK